MGQSVSYQPEDERRAAQPRNGMRVDQAIIQALEPWVEKLGLSPAQPTI